MLIKSAFHILFFLEELNWTASQDGIKETLRFSRNYIVIEEWVMFNVTIQIL